MAKKTTSKNSAIQEIFTIGKIAVITILVIFLLALFNHILEVYRMHQAAFGPPKGNHHNTLDSIVPNPSAFPEEYRKITPIITP